jgi:hypothetical protein
MYIVYFSGSTCVYLDLFVKWNKKQRDWEEVRDENKRAGELLR